MNGMWPFRMEPVDTLAEQASANSDPEDNPTAGTGNWLPQLRITKDFFSTKT